MFLEVFLCRDTTPATKASIGNTQNIFIKEEENENGNITKKNASNPEHKLMTPSTFLFDNCFNIIN